MVVELVTANELERNSEEETRWLFDQIDEDNSGSLDLKEVCPIMTM